MRKWRIEDSAELYNITGWGLKVFFHQRKRARRGYAPGREAHWST